MASIKKEAKDYLESVRTALFNGRHPKAEDIINKNMHGTWSAGYAFWQAGVPRLLNMLYDHYEYTKDTEHTGKKYCPF